MTSLKRWLLTLGLAGSCLTWVGCGGGDAPEADSDTSAAPSAPAAPAAAPAVAANEAESATPPAPAKEEARPAATAKTTETASAPAATPAETTADPAQPAAANSNAAAEMLALGNKTPTPAQNTSADATAQSGSGTPEGAPAGPASAAFPGAPPGSSGGPAGPTAGAGPAGFPAAPGGGPAGGPNNEEMQRRMMEEQQKMMAANAANNQAPGGGPGQNNPGADPGGVGGVDVPASFHNPYGAVQAFLNALKAKDPERLREATALRAPTEATGKNQKLFAAILEQSLGEDGINDLANKLEGFRVYSQNEAKSTGRLGIILQKPGKMGNYYTRTITVRHEKAGWKVVDISGEREIEKPISIPRGMMRGRGRIR